MTAIEISLAHRFWEATSRLAPGDLARVHGTIGKFMENPEQQGLRLEKLHDPRGRIWSIRASDDLRIILLREGSTWVVVDAGQHDEVYERVRRARTIVRPDTGFIAIVPDPIDLTDHEPVAESITISGPEVENDRGIFDHWGHSDLREAGFDTAEIDLIRRSGSIDDLFACGLSERALDRAIDLVEMTPDEWRSPSLLGEDDSTAGRLRRAIKNFGSAHGLSQFLSAEELTRLARAPIEEWMIFLHPDQRSIVERRFDGPGRIRGAAGTGKTAVALHRTAALSKRLAVSEPEALPILFTTFIKSLPPVFEDLYRRLPNSAHGSVVFIHVDRLARQFVDASGETVHLDMNAISASFSKAKQRSIAPDSPLALANLTDKYLTDEVQKVIKGRGISSLDEYLEIERTGRIVPFNRAIREQMWELHLAWNEEMAQRGTIDFADVLLRARDLARKSAVPKYRAAIIDEAQDLTLVGLQFVQALVTGSAPTVPSDGLLLVGDGAQRIYPGCYTLRQAGIEVGGRSSILRTNYRNTAEILAAAMAVAGDLAVEDLDEEFKRGEAEVTSPRSAGHRPLVALHPTVEAEQAFVIDRIRGLVEHDDVALGDIGLFLPTNALCSEFLTLLRTAGIATVDLSTPTTRADEGIKVGTYFRAKGLEMKIVILPAVGERFPMPPRPGQGPSEHEEAQNLWISALFVAMTRARDELIITCAEHPSSLIVEHLDFFDLVEY